LTPLWVIVLQPTKDMGNKYVAQYFTKLIFTPNYSSAQYTIFVSKAYTT